MDKRPGLEPLFGDHHVYLNRTVSHLAAMVLAVSPFADACKTAH